MSSTELESTRLAFAEFATGVCIVTAAADGQPMGMTVSSFNSVSLEPPLVLWSVGKHAPEYASFCSADYYVIHILAKDQVALSNRFATPGIDKFEGLAYTVNDQNIPLLADVGVRFHCRARHNYPAGDHNILVGLVTGIEQLQGEDNRAPLVYYSSDYREIGLQIPH